MQLPTISITTHRGVRCFRWKTKGVKRYRVIQPGNEDQQRSQLILELAAGPKRKVVAKSVEEHLADYIEHLGLTVNEKWADMTGKRIKRIVAQAEITDLADITAATVNTTICKLRCTPRKPKKAAEAYPFLSENSRNHYRQAIKSWMTWMLNEERITTEPLRKLSKQVVKAGKQRHRRDGLRADEVEALVMTTASRERTIEGYDGTTRAWLYFLASVTGLRRGELAALTPNCFDWSGKLLRLSGEFTKNGDDAECPLPAPCVPALRKWLSGHTGPIFPDLRIKRVAKMVMLDLTTAGLPVSTPLGRRTFHSLRNAFVSRLFELGVPGPAVKNLSRHGTDDQAAAYYRTTGVDLSVIESLVSATAIKSLGGPRGVQERGLDRENARNA